jgi:hypothetical protein
MKRSREGGIVAVAVVVQGGLAVKVQALMAEGIVHVGNAVGVG